MNTLNSKNKNTVVEKKKDKNYTKKKGGSLTQDIV